MIHIFGDSFSDNLWPRILTEKTGIDHVNYSKTGETNLFILTTLIENLNNNDTCFKVITIYMRQPEKSERIASKKHPFKPRIIRERTNQLSHRKLPKYQIPNVEYEAENGKTAIPKRRSLKAKLIIR